MLSAYMQLAVQQALRGGPATYQNPQVGAVLVKDHRVISQGYHHQFGGDHAEVDCLKRVSPAEARGATLYVTLEPCSHFGKTPPCCRRVADTGVKRVVIGQLDPHPIVAGRGRDYLKAHGVAVTVLAPSAAVEDLNRHYNWFYRHQRPWITLKTAQTLDGKINAVGGERSLISGSASYADSQRLRTHFHAILIGERTLVTDDPQLTVRLQALRYPPVRLVLLNTSTVAVNKRVTKTDGVATWLLCRRPADTDAQLDQRPNVHVVVGDWSPATVAAFCQQHGWQSLLVEGGSHVQAQFVQAGLVEEWCSYLSPQLFGGGSLPAVHDDQLQGAPVQFDRPTLRVSGQDIRLQAYRTGVL